MSLRGVSITWCQRQSDCKWCSGVIETATPLVTTYYWHKGADGKRWHSNVRYHPQCWIEQGLDYLKMNPYCAGGKRGAKPRLKLSATDASRRLLLLRKKASLEQRKRLLDPERGDYLAASVSLDIKIMDCLTDIAPIGGVPKSWLI